MQYEIGAATRCSASRGSGLNEDAMVFAHVWISTKDSNLARLVMFLADGMGALDMPHVASSLAIREAIRTFVSSEESQYDATIEAVMAANRALLKVKPELDFGSTLTCLSLEKDRFALAHVGDNRLFQVDDVIAVCLTTDHSKLATMLNVANPSLKDAKSNKKSKKLLKSLGEKELAVNDIFVAKGVLKQSETLILCSDGLWTEITPEEVIAINAGFAQSQQVAEELVHLAAERDATDDISVIVARPAIS